MGRIAVALFALILLSAGGSTPALHALDPTYRVPPPDGKLPWPQHKPAFSQAEYDSMMSGLFIINNFGLYQGADTRDSVYFHDGLDVVLPNGTVLYAIASGTVRGVLGSAPYYETLVIEDDDKPGGAWTYTHVRPVKTAMKIGQRVLQGAPIATVWFQGVEHVHLNRTFLAPGGSWRDFYSHNNVMPDPFFHFTDTESPVIETPFYYFLNESYDMLPRGSPTFVSGQIDVVAGVRDPGEYAQGRIGSLVAYGNHNAPMRLQVSVAPAADPRRVLWTHSSIDFSRVILNWRRPHGLRDRDRVETVFFFRPSLNRTIPSNGAVFSYYVVTNGGPNEELRPIAVADGAPAWDTGALDASGRPIFPDGEYILTLTAWDSQGNAGSAEDRVVVRNR